MTGLYCLVDPNACLQWLWGATSSARCKHPILHHKSLKKLSGATFSRTCASFDPLAQSHTPPHPSRNTPPPAAWPTHTCAPYRESGSNVGKCLSILALKLLTLAFARARKMPQAPPPRTTTPARGAQHTPARRPTCLHPTSHSFFAPRPVTERASAKHNPCSIRQRLPPPGHSTQTWSAQATHSADTLYRHAAPRAHGRPRLL